MQDRIEPPILLSRLVVFLFAGAVVVLAALGFTLYKMFPLNRPQVYFLMTQPRENLEITLTELPPTDENMKWFMRAFIREYIKARNEITPDSRAMLRKWNNDENGVVHTWSTPDVYAAFTQTNMWTALMNNTPDFEFSCSVEFENGAITPRTADTFAVSFKYFCEDSGGQTDKKDYTIIVKLQMDDNATLKWSDRLDNPLGLRVSEYKIESGNGDPLNTGYLASGE